MMPLCDALSGMCLDCLSVRPGKSLVMCCSSLLPPLWDPSAVASQLYRLILVSNMRHGHCHAPLCRPAAGDAGEGQGHRVQATEGASTSMLSARPHRLVHLPPHCLVPLCDAHMCHLCLPHLLATSEPRASKPRPVPKSKAKSKPKLPSLSRSLTVLRNEMGVGCTTAPDEYRPSLWLTMTVYGYLVDPTPHKMECEVRK